MSEAAPGSVATADGSLKKDDLMAKAVAILGPTTWLPEPLRKPAG
jgi:streptogramin lyase